MTRFLICFRSHSEGPADTHVVVAEASHALEAIKLSLRECPPLHPWKTVRAWKVPEKLRRFKDAEANEAAKIIGLRVG